MTAVASRELCRELSLLVDWKPDGWYSKGIFRKEDHVIWKPLEVVNNKYLDCPAFDLRYLLNKVPVRATEPRYPALVRTEKGYEFGYEIDDTCTADTPEDAVCMFCIKMQEAKLLGEKTTYAEENSRSLPKTEELTQEPDL